VEKINATLLGAIPRERGAGTVKPFDRAQDRQEEMKQHTKPLLPPALSSVEGLWSSFKRRCGIFGSGTPERKYRNIFAMIRYSLCLQPGTPGGW
jgi:hypothetical protein